MRTKFEEITTIANLKSVVLSQARAHYGAQFEHPHELDLIHRIKDSEDEAKQEIVVQLIAYPRDGTTSKWKLVKAKSVKPTDHQSAGKQVFYAFIEFAAEMQEEMNADEGAMNLKRHAQYSGPSTKKV